MNIEKIIEKILLHDSQGIIWISCVDNIWIRYDNEWKFVSKKVLKMGKYNNREIALIEEDPIGRIWVFWKHINAGLFGISVLGVNARKLE